MTIRKTPIVRGSPRPRTIGGSEAATVLGIGRHQTAQELYDDKYHGQTWDNPPVTGDIARGHALEPVIIEMFSNIHRPDLPEIIQCRDTYYNDTYPFAHASPDGFMGRAVVEVKAPRSGIAAQCAAGAWPEAWIIQVRHNMMVCEAALGLLIVLDPDRWTLEHKFLARDAAIEEKLIEAERAFYDALMAGDPYAPETTRAFSIAENGDAVKMESPAWVALADKYRQVEGAIKRLTDAKDALSDALKAMAGEAKRAYGGGLSLTRYVSERSAIDRKKLEEDGIDATKYSNVVRTPCTRITLSKKGQDDV